MQAAAAAGSQWGYETTVGAGLPIVNVLRNDLLDTGDRREAEGPLDNLFITLYFIHFIHLLRYMH